MNVVKYHNRKYYVRGEHRYMTLIELHILFEEKADLTVKCQKTKLDITELTKASALYRATIHRLRKVG